MADHYNLFPMKTFAATVADCMDLPLPETYAKGIDWVSALMKQRMGGTADRVVLYHADAVGMHIWQKYTDLFAPVYAHTSLAVPMLSTVESVTPVSHASMYTGLDPEQHGIMTYVRPKLECSTLFDVLLDAGKKVAIVAQLDSTFLHIFEGRNLDYFEARNAIEVQEKALELIATNRRKASTPSASRLTASTALRRRWLPIPVTARCSPILPTMASTRLPAITAHTARR